MNNRAEAPPSPLPEPTGIVSVNSRGGTSTGLAPKIAFVIVLLVILAVGGLSGYKRFQDSRNGNDNAIARVSESARPLPSKPRKIFAPEPMSLQPIPGAVTAPAAVSPCPDGEPAHLLTGPGGQPIPDSGGKPLQVCKGGQLVLSPDRPMLGDTLPAGPAKPPQMTTPAPSSKPNRFGGDVAISRSTLLSGALVATDSGTPAVDETERSTAVPIRQRNDKTALSSGPRSTAVLAGWIGNRDMIIPQGRSIDCNLSMRLVTEVSGMATCVLSSNVYSDSGRVVLAERGSVVTGEYAALTEQGQRRIFVLWTRLQTPLGVIIDINSPTADALGTSGLPGIVDNRWRERIGAAVLLSLVDDAIGYQTAKASSAGPTNGAQGIAILENSTRTGRTLAERILDSTINIKPTVFKQQGDRATIFVSRDLDFGGVYALRAK